LEKSFFPEEAALVYQNPMFLKTEQISHKRGWYDYWYYLPWSKAEKWFPIA